MKFLVVYACILALASAGYPYYYNQHIPIIDHNGVPVDTPEVQAAKAIHLAAHAAAHNGVHITAPYTGHGVARVASDGTPLDTPEVQLAKAAHYIAYNQAAFRNSAGHYYGAPYVAAAAAPLDTPEVQLAKAAHFAAHAKARAGHHYRKRRGLAYTYPQHIPVIGPNGVPVDTPEVQAAKSQHFAALAQAQVRNALAPPDTYDYNNRYTGPYHIPVIGPNGVPVETPEVQAAKAEHFAAYGKVNSGGYPAYSGHYSAPAFYGSGAPADTPEVQAAKAAHLAAHAAAGGHQHHYY